MTTTYTDRSRALECQRCPRARWWGYEWGRGREAPAGGITPVRMSIPLSTGIYVHRGIAHLLDQVGRRWGYLPTNELAAIVEEAIHQAITSYAMEIAARGLQVEAGADASFTAVEQSALIEAQIRAWASYRMPLLLADYEVLEVEREYELPLGQHWENFDDGTGFPHNLIWQSRADALLKHRATGDLFILSLKTKNAWDKRAEKENAHDVQGISEAVAVEHALEEQGREERNRICGDLWALRRTPEDIGTLDPDELRLVADALETWLTTPRRVEGILMDFLLKGKRDQVDRASPYLQQSPLIRAWRREHTDPVTLEVTWDYAWSYWWRCGAPHRVEYANGRTKECDGFNRNHNLGSTWQTFNVWEHGDFFRVALPDGSTREYAPGVRGWISLLADSAQQPQCGCICVSLPSPDGPCPVCGQPFRPVPVIQPDAGWCLPAQFVTPAPYRRQQVDLEDWAAQAAAQEAAVAENAEMIRRVEDPHNRRELLNRLFPQHRRSCHYPSDCDFVAICHESVAHCGEIDPLALGIYQPRVPHHAPELAAQAPSSAESAAPQEAAAHDA